MRADAFRRWFAQADGLTPAQRGRAVEALRQERRAPNPLAGIVDGEPACPHCAHRPCGRWGHSHGLPR